MKLRPLLLRLLRHVAPGYLVLSALWSLNWGIVVVTGVILRAVFDSMTGDAQAGLNVYSFVALFAVANTTHLMAIQPSTWIVWNYVSILLAGRIQRNLLRAILGNRPTAHGLSPGDMINRFRVDVGEAAMPIFLIGNMTGLVVSLAAGIYIMVRINPLITIVAIVPSIVIFFLTKALGKWIEAYRRRSREATGRVSGSLGEFLGAVQALQIADAEERAVEHFQGLSEERKRADLKEGVIDGVIGALNASVATVVTGVVLLTAAQLMRTGSFTVGDFSLFVSILGGAQTTGALRWIGQFVASLRRARVSFQRLFELVPESPPDALVEGGSLHLWGAIPRELETRSHAGLPLDSVELVRLTYTYGASGRGIEGVSLKLPRGSFTVITGRIGSGKTTLLQVMLGLLPLDSGEVRWNGERVGEPLTFMVPPRCAYAPQSPWLFSDTVRDNILMGIEADEARLQAAVRLGVLEQDVAELESGLDTLVGPRGVRLSGGQVQRTAAARMFVRKPELFVFDDLSSALDVETEQELWRRVFELEDATCLVISHRRAAFQHADNILVMKDGKVEAEGKLDDLLQTSEEMRRLWAGDVGPQEPEATEDVGPTTRSVPEQDLPAGGSQ